MKPFERYRYKLALEQLAAKEIKSVTENDGFVVSWNQGGCEGMAYETFPTIEAAIEDAKSTIEFTFNGQNYADREDYPSIWKEFTVENLDGSKRNDSDDLYHCYTWQ